MSRAIGVIGASGRLGRIIVSQACARGWSVTALSRRAHGGWPETVVHAPLQDWSDTEAFGKALKALDAVIVAAQTPDIALHRIALQHGCHLVDVVASADHVAAGLALDPLAKASKVSLVLAAGLAPGLSGVLAKHMVTSFPDAARVDVLLLQSAQGSAGFAGTCEMLDMLTDGRVGGWVHAKMSAAHPRGRPVHGAFAFPTVDSALGSLPPQVAFYTRFDSNRLNMAIRLLSLIRRVSPGLYRRLRNRVARHKANTPSARLETVELRTTASEAGGAVLGAVCRRFDSDYEATAALSQIATEHVCRGALTSGAHMLHETMKQQDFKTSRRPGKPLTACSHDKRTQNAFPKRQTPPTEVEGVICSVA